MAHRYDVEILPEPPVVPSKNRARFTTCLSRRLSKLSADGTPATAGGAIDILDGFDGPFVWEMTPEQLEQTPPKRVDFKVVSLVLGTDGVTTAVVQLNQPG